MDPVRCLTISLEGASPTPDERAWLRERSPGGVCLFSRNLRDRVQAAELTAELRALAGDDLLVSIDQEGGGVVRLRDVPSPPSTMALGAADDPELTRAVAAATGRGLRAVGVNVDFAPVADVDVDPANPVIAERAFGDRAEHVARHVAAFVEGLQAEGVAAVAKHFPGHGDVNVDSHLALPSLEADRERLERLELVPFRAALAAGAAGVMTAHLLVPALGAVDEPATLSPAVIGGLLRAAPGGEGSGGLGFDGLVVTDALDMRAVADRWGAGEATVLALLAGVDMAVRVGPLAEHVAACGALDQALAEGRLPEERVREAVRRVEAVARRFPARPDPGAAWRADDEELLEDAARRGLVALGPVPRPAPGARLRLVASERRAPGAASDASEDPAAALAEALEGRGWRVDVLRYDPDAPAPPAPAALDGAELVAFVSTSRTRMGAAEADLARAVAAAAGSRFLHVGLRNPRHADDLPGPALLAFGGRGPSVRAVAAALAGELEPSARAPVRLEGRGR